MRILYYAISLDHLESSSIGLYGLIYSSYYVARAVWDYAAMSCPSCYTKAPADT